MYADPRHRKDVVIKLRIDEFCAEMFRREAALRRTQPAVLARLLVERFLLDQGIELPGVELSDPLEALVHSCARRDGVVDAEWHRRVIGQYLADQGYEVPDEHNQSRMAG